MGSHYGSPRLLEIVSDLPIAAILGQQVSVKGLRKRGARVVGISLCKVFGAALAVGMVLVTMGVNPVVAILLAGVAPGPSTANAGC